MRIRYDPQLLALVSERPVEYLPLFEEAVREALAKLVPSSEAEDLPDFQVLVNSDQVGHFKDYYTR
jgi:DNA replicative helicase MCM subunit Mcm2 (Cdc46/Mcm family)